MEHIASWIWNPVFSFIYLEIGIIMLIITGFIAWRKLIPQLLYFWKQGKQTASKNASNSVHEKHITPYKAFITALAASIGVGNVAGVSTAIHLGGPGALFWLWVSALVGMTFRLSSTWLTFRYQSKDPNHPAYATPMSYLGHFFNHKWRWIPMTLATLLIMQGFLSANLIQSNSMASAIENEIDSPHLLVGLFMASLVGFVTLGGVKKIVNYSVLVTPWMILAYFFAGLFILLSDPLITLSSLSMVFEYAFTPYSVAGGVVGYTVLQSIQFGISRGVFSHGAGMGVAPFFHASNNEDVRFNSYLAALVPFVDTMLVCSITALVVLNQGFWGEFNGAFLTTTSFQHFYGNAGKFLILACLLVFSFTTIISWSYYTEKCFHYLGGKNIFMFRWIFIFITFCGPFFPVELIWSMGDIVIASLLTVHLLPLFYLVIMHRKEMMKEL